VRSPGEVLREMLAQNAWTQDELALIMGVSRVSVANVIAGRSGITPEMASLLAAAFANDAAYWMQLDAQYRLGRISPDTSPVERRAHLFQIAPIRDMQRRGWIAEDTDVDSIERELERFFGQPIHDRVPEFLVATRKTSIGPTNAAERAWCFEARRLASIFPVALFEPKKLPELATKLRRLAMFAKETRKVSKLLAEYGIRFVVVEPISGAKIDGAAFWMSEDAPVIAISIRFDRVDAFWFTLMHELAHIMHGDAYSVDSNLVGENSLTATSSSNLAVIEQRANEKAASLLIDQEDLNSFIRRVGPLYSKQRIIQFAHVTKVHPGIIIGQLQHRGEISYGANRDLLVKVRDIVIQTALTDGWGHFISPSSFER